MEKILTISLDGRSFTIDETAYNTLSDYLHQIEMRLERPEEITDIERRLADILAELNPSVVDTDTVRPVRSVKTGHGICTERAEATVPQSQEPNDRRRLRRFVRIFRDRPYYCPADRLGLALWRRWVPALCDRLDHNPAATSLFYHEAEQSITVVITRL